MHAQYLWGHYLMPLVLLIFLFLLQNWCSAGRQMSLSAHPAGFNTSHPFLVQPEQSSHNQLVLFWSTPTSLVEPFSLPLSHIFRGSVVYVSLPISPDEKHQLAQWGFTQCHAACSFLPPPGRSRPQVRVASIFQPSPSHRGCPGQPWGVLSGSLPGTSGSEAGCDTFAPSSCHFKLQQWKGWGAFFFPLCDSFHGSTTLDFPLVLLGGKSLPFSVLAFFSYQKQRRIILATFRGWFIRQTGIFYCMDNEKIFRASRLSGIVFLPSACGTTYYLSYFSNFNCFSQYVVQGQKELKKHQESSYSIFSVFLERSSS